MSCGACQYNYTRGKERQRLGTHPERRPCNELLVHKHAHRARKELVLARVLHARLDERRRALARHAHVAQFRRELERRDHDPVRHAVARQRRRALDAVRERERAPVERRAFLRVVGGLGLEVESQVFFLVSRLFLDEESRGKAASPGSWSWR